MKAKKRIAALCLSATMALSMATTAMAAPNSSISYIKSGNGGYSDDYRYWSQGASSDANIRGWGCLTVAESKLLMESGAVVEDGFNPDVYKSYSLKTGYLNPDTYLSATSRVGMYQYEAHAVEILQNSGETVSIGDLCQIKRERTIKCAGYSVADIKSEIMQQLEDGKYLIVHYGSVGHYIYVSREESLEAGEPIVWNSYSSWCENPTTYSTLDKANNSPSGIDAIEVYYISNPDADLYGDNEAISYYNNAKITMTSAPKEIEEHGAKISANMASDKFLIAWNYGINFGQTKQMTSSREYSAYALNKSFMNNLNMSFDLGALKSGTIYYYQPYVVMADGTHIYGDTKMIKTKSKVVDTSYTGYISSAVDEYLIINSRASSGYGIGKIPEGTACTVYPDKSQGNWYYVSYNGVSGYAYGSYIQKGEPTTAPAVKDNSYQGRISYDVDGCLIINSRASAGYEIGRIPEGAYCTVYPDKSQGNWYYVSYNGVSGYAYGAYID